MIFNGWSINDFIVDIIDSHSKIFIHYCEKNNSYDVIEDEIVFSCFHLAEYNYQHVL